MQILRVKSFLTYFYVRSGTFTLKSYYSVHLSTLLFVLCVILSLPSFLLYASHITLLGGEYYTRVILF